MSKEPAILFYTGDFLNGCTDLTFEERGQYITLLCLQHQKGHLSDKTIRLSVGSVNGDVMKKFKKDELGCYYNERLDDEMIKRQQFVDSRRDNGKKGGRPTKTYAKANGKPTDNLREDEDINKKEEEVIRRRRKQFVPPVLNEVRNYFKDNGFRDNIAIKAFNYYNSANWKDSEGKQILNWKQKMIGVWFKDENKIIQNVVVPEFNSGPNR